MTDTAPTASSVAATLARIKSELPPDTATNIDGLLNDFAFVVKTEGNADIKARAPHIPLVGGWVTAGGASLFDHGVDAGVNAIETAIAAQLQPEGTQ